jgi:hypothetical protein
MAQRHNYWSCTRFADWVRGKPKLKAGTSDEWHNWENEAKGYHPVRYWIAEEALDAIQNFIWWPVDQLYALKYYINNRFVTRTHSLTAHPRDIRPGQWCDVGNRFLPCLFNELVDFVEIESAWSHIAWGSKEDRAKYNPPFWASGWFRWRVWRCPQAGIDHLDWAMTLTNTDWCEPDHKDYGKPTGQALRAKEIKELYTWWTTVYPNRPDPHDISGWSEYCEKKRDLNDGRLFGSKETPEIKKLGNQALKLSTKIEKQYADEDEIMMIRLIKARDSLWT